ncbi:MAG TPA: CHRD domain-containing protein [Gaiellaceae bacterium]|nr:CHRD domain-containing protein [Gaiellaceae bacterium]
MRRRSLVVAAVLVSGAFLVASLAVASGGKRNLKSNDLSGYEENPDLSTAGTGSFKVTIDDAGPAMIYELSYSGLESDATQAHVHFGKTAINGGISFFICSNLGNGPAGTPACPLRSATLTRTITAADVLGPLGQGIPAGAFAELAAAMRAGHTYANVHTTGFPSGELRAQINDKG